MKIETAKTYTATIHIAGEYHRIKDICARYCQKGLCVSLAKTDYIYTGGQQSGYAITLINYPRFKSTSEKINQEAFELAKMLIIDGYQDSCTIITTDNSYYMSKRGEDK